MACPYLSGSAALLMEASGGHANITGDRIRAILQTTASPLKSTHNETSLIETTVKQGSGLVQVWNAVHYTTVVTPGELLLNDTANAKLR